MVLTIVLIAFAVLKILDLIKFSLLSYGYSINAVSKIILSVLLAALFAIFFMEDVKWFLLVTFAAAGISSLLHDFQSLLSLLTDRVVQQIMSRTGVR